MAVASIALVGMGASGCGSAVHQASVAADSIGVSLATAAVVNHDLAAAGSETIAERELVAGYIDKAARANDAFVATLKQATASGTQLSAAKVLKDFQTLATQINVLESDGVFRISNPAAQAKFQAVLGAIRAQVAIIQAIIGAQASNSSPGHGNPFLPAAPLMAGGLIFTPALIEEAITLSAQLTSKIQQIKAATDPKLQSDALAQDAAAEAQAEADEKPI